MLKEEMLINNKNYALIWNGEYAVVIDEDENDVKFLGNYIQCREYMNNLINKQTQEQIEDMYICEQKNIIKAMYGCYGISASWKNEGNIKRLLNQGIINERQAKILLAFNDSIGFDIICKNEN